MREPCHAVNQPEARLNTEFALKASTLANEDSSHPVKLEAAQLFEMPAPVQTLKTKGHSRKMWSSSNWQNLFDASPQKPPLSSCLQYHSSSNSWFTGVLVIRATSTRSKVFLNSSIFQPSPSGSSKDETLCPSYASPEKIEPAFLPWPFPRLLLRSTIVKPESSRSMLARVFELVDGTLEISSCIVESGAKMGVCCGVVGDLDVSPLPNHLSPIGATMRRKGALIQTPKQ
nr:hypothetical protein Iba_chr07aCG7800 [Ipomoea batatas]